MVDRVHVLIRSGLGGKHSGTSFALKARGPVVILIHMVLPVAPACEAIVATVAFN